ncbi:MAG: TRAP transporter small permease [Lachnospiraceae bacterium]|nr:TRAP transporter small permease [Lachnospiraceae bacterium]
MRKISKYMGICIEKILFVLMIVLVAITFLQVLSRFVFKIPVSWSQEVVKLCFVWIIFLGSAIAVKEETHLTLDMLTALLPEKLQKIVRIIILLLMLLCAGILLYGGSKYCANCIGKTMITLPFPANIQYVSMPVSAVMMIWYLAERLKSEILGKEKNL